MKQKKKTIKDVAKLANVSIATVSNTLNNVDVVKPETRERVLAAAKELHYAPNLMGRQLRSGQTKMLGLFTDSISGPYFYKLVETIAHEVDRHGYGMHIIITSDHDKMLDSILGSIVDGAIIFEHNMDDKDISQIKEHQLPTVLIDRVDSGPKMSSIVFDSLQEGYMTATHLLNLGHRKIAYVDGVPNNYDSNQRRNGIRLAVEEHGLEWAEMPILPGKFEEGLSASVVREYLNETKNSSTATAFIAANDLSAIGVIKAIQAAGYRVPEDFSVVGFDDIDISEYFNPAITTIRNPIARQGIMAVNELFGMITQGNKGQKISLTGDLVARNSTSVPNQER